MARADAEEVSKTEPGMAKRRTEKPETAERGTEISGKVKPDTEAVSKTQPDAEGHPDAKDPEDTA